MKIVTATAGALAAPRIVSSLALATEGELTILSWSDYLQPDFIELFTKETGIKVVTEAYSQNEELRNKLRAGSKPDVLQFDCRLTTAFAAEGFLASVQDIDSEAALARIRLAADEIGATVDGKRMAIPLTWSTEAVAYSQIAPDAGEVTYEALWDPKREERLTFRPASALTSAALLQESRREISSIGLLYQDEKEARAILERAAQIVIENRPRVAVFWEQEGQALGTMADNQAQLGQIDEPTGYQVSLKLGDPDGHFRSPREGAIGWIDGMGVTSWSARTEEAKAWITFNLNGEVGARLAEKTGYNSASQKALASLSEPRKSFLLAAHPIIVSDSGGGNDPCEKATECRCEDRTCAESCCRNRVVVGNVYWPREQPDWLVALRAEYADKIRAA